MRFLNLWVKICIIFLLSNLSNGQLSTGQLSTNPFYLTDGKNGEKSIPYRATGQCMPKTEANAKTYGLSFRLHSKGGHCDDGLLICYPGMLMRHYSTGFGSSAFKVKGTFQVDNEKNGSVSQKCNAFLEKNGITNGKHWRGMNVYTKSLNDRKTNPSRQTILETSLTPNVYELGTNVGQFSIHLGGNGTDLLTMITLNEEKKPFIDNESNLQIHEQFSNGAFLREHNGLWMLGMDLLPSMEQQNVKLFIARDCSCTMEAWFTQPTDSIDPKEPELPTAGSNNCPIKETDQTFSIDLTGLDLPAKIVIKAITDDKLNNIIVELLHGDEMDKNGNVLMKITIGTTDDLTVILPGTAPNVIQNFRLPRKSHIMRLEIYLYEYCYGLALNGTETGGLFWPNHWWNRKKVKSIKLNGQMLLLEDPRVDKLAGNEFKNIRFPTVELPIVLNGLEQAEIIINATTDVNVNNITVELLHGDEMGKNGDALMEFTITTEYLEVFLPETDPIVIKSSQLLVGNHKMLLKIYLLKYCYAISLNGNRLGDLFWPKDWWNRKEVNSIKLNGQMLLLEDPRVEYNKTRLVELPKFWPIAGFREHSTFLFRIQLLNPSSGFKIIFSNNSTFDGITDKTAFVVQVVDLKRVELGIYYGGRAHPEQANRKDSSFKAGNAYEFFICVSDRFYGIRLNGENLFENYANSMPFCDIKFVRVEGDAVLLENPEIYVPPPEKEVVKSVTKALDNVLNYGDSIVLDGQMENGAKNFRVHLMHNSPRCSKIYDEVAEMEFNLVTGQIECRHKLHEEGGEWTNGGKNSDKLSLLTQKPLNLKILMAKSGFYARNGAANWIEICPYYMPKQKSMATTFIPPWAINHIRIEGDVTLIQEKIRVENISTGDLQMASTNNVNKTVPWKRIQFTKVIKKEGVNRFNYAVLIKITLEGVLKPNSEVRINLFNEALEVHKLFGSTVLQVKLHNNSLSFNSFSNQTWLMPKQNNSYTFAIEPEKDQKRTIYIFDIRVTNSEFFVKLHGKETELKYPVDQSVRNMDIQYITVELENVKLIAGTEVEVMCHPQERCINQK